MDKRRVLALEWLKAVESIRYIIHAEHLTNIVAFHAQQTIEKSFKAILEFENAPFMKTHNLEKLYSLLGKKPKIEMDGLMLINELYIESRYPGEMGLLPHGKPSLEDAKEFHAFAEEVFGRVCEVLEFDRKKVRNEHR